MCAHALVIPANSGVPTELTSVMCPVRTRLTNAQNTLDDNHMCLTWNLAASLPPAQEIFATSVGNRLMQVSVRSPLGQ